MNELLQADIFFFVSTILLSAISVVFIVALFYVVKVVKDVRSITRIVHRETERLATDVESLRESMKRSDWSPGGIFSFVSSFVKGGRKAGKGTAKRSSRERG